MPNDAAAEKAGSAEHGDGAIGRCHHDSNSPIHVGAFTAGSRGTYPGDRVTARHDEVFHRQSFDQRFPEIVESNGPPEAVGRPPLAIDSLLVRPEAQLSRLPD